ncbi:MAG: DUF3039 domain-containing protein [Trueperella sp.]|nr:DUF3039 domain-containing protein [Trueperella sp.]
MSDPLEPYSAPDDPGQSAAGTATLTETRPVRTEGDDERYAHYVRKDRIMQSAVEGGPVVALCGKVWTPTRNPDRYPVCPTCKAIRDGMGGGGDWPLGPNVPGGDA